MGLQRKGFEWGRIKGKLSTTPEQSLKMFGFVQNPLASGIIFREYWYTDAEGTRKKGTFINNYFPPTNPQTSKQQANRNRFSILSKIATEHNSTLISNIWQPLAEERHKVGAHGANEFRSQNMKRIGTPPDWLKMSVSDGILYPTREVTDYYISGADEITVTFDPSIFRNAQATDTILVWIYDEDLHTLQRVQQSGTPPFPKRGGGTFTGTVTTMPVNSICFVAFYGYKENIYSPSASRMAKEVPIMTDISMTYRSDTDKYTSLFVAIDPGTKKVFLRALKEKAVSLIDNILGWDSWKDFGNPDPTKDIKGVSVSIERTIGSNYSALITVILDNEVTWLRALKDKTVNQIGNILSWGNWVNFGDPNP